MSFDMDQHLFDWILQLMNLFYLRISNPGMYYHHIIIQHYWQVLQSLKILHLIYWLICLGALFQSKIDIERLYDYRSLYSSTHSDQNAITNRTSRLLFIFLGIILVALIFGLTVVFFQRMYVEMNQFNFQSSFILLF
jgi:hypothetical protein